MVRTKMTPEQFTDWLVLHGAAEAARLGITPPQTAITRMACGQDSDIELILTIRRRQRATLQYDEETKTSFIGPAPTKPPPALSGIKKAIYDAAPKADAEPKTAKAIAKLANYSYGEHFRNHLNELIEVGILVRVRGGVKRT